jgi:spermidine/putrescine-binding protein
MQKWQHRMLNGMLTATANSAAKEFIDEEMLADESIYPSDEVVANLEFIEDLGEVNEIYENKFFEAKSSN